MVSRVISRTNLKDPHQCYPIHILGEVYLLMFHAVLLQKLPKGIGYLARTSVMMWPLVSLRSRRLWEKVRRLWSEPMRGGWRCLLGNLLFGGKGFETAFGAEQRVGAARRYRFWARRALRRRDFGGLDEQGPGIKRSFTIRAGNKHPVFQVAPNCQRSLLPHRHKPGV